MKRLAKEENQGTMALDSGICEMENCSRQHMVCAHVCVCVCLWPGTHLKGPCAWTVF